MSDHLLNGGLPRGRVIDPRQLAVEQPALRVSISPCVVAPKSRTTRLPLLKRRDSAAGSSTFAETKEQRHVEL